MKLSVRAININSCAKKVQVDNRLPLRYYYRIADSLIKQVRLSLRDPFFAFLFEVARGCELWSGFVGISIIWYLDREGRYS